MNYWNGIKLNYKDQKRDNYMGFKDLIKDLTTDTLIKILPTLRKLNNQMSLMSEIEQRDELNDDYYFELLESCNGI